jgi:hypothetical protein
LYTAIIPENIYDIFHACYVACLIRFLLVDEMDGSAVLRHYYALEPLTSVAAINILSYTCNIPGVTIHAHNLLGVKNKTGTRIIGFLANIITVYLMSYIIHVIHNIAAYPGLTATAAVS